MEANNNVLPQVAEAVADMENGTYVEKLDREKQLQVPYTNVNQPIVSKSTVESFNFNWGSNGFDMELDYIIKDYLPASSFGVLYGPSGGFKSFHALCWAASIATGREWNGKRSSGGSVLYVVGEGGIGVPRRVKGWENQYNNGKNIKLFTINHPVFVGSKEQVDALIKTVRNVEAFSGERVKAIFLDTLARCFAGGDENKASDMNMFIAGCDRVKTETGASIVVVHHSGKNVDLGARGSSSLRAASDFEFRISRPEGEKFYKLEHTKAKDSEEQPAQVFDMYERFLFTDRDGDDVCTLVPSDTGREPPAEQEPDKQVSLSKNQEALLQAVRSRTATGESTDKAVIRDDLKAQGLSISNFSKWLTSVCEKGLAEVSEDGKITLIQKL